MRETLFLVKSAEGVSRSQPRSEDISDLCGQVGRELGFHRGRKGLEGHRHRSFRLISARCPGWRWWYGGHGLVVSRNAGQAIDFSFLVRVHRGHLHVLSSVFRRHLT